MTLRCGQQAKAPSPVTLRTLPVQEAKGSIVNSEPHDAHVVRVEYSVAEANALPLGHHPCCASCHLEQDRPFLTPEHPAHLLDASGFSLSRSQSRALYKYSLYHSVFQNYVWGELIYMGLSSIFTTSSFICYQFWIKHKNQRPRLRPRKTPHLSVAYFLDIPIPSPHWVLYSHATNSPPVTLNISPVWPGEQEPKHRTTAQPLPPKQMTFCASPV